MEVQLSPTQQRRLESLAAERGAEEAVVLSQMIDRALEHEEWFDRAVHEAKAELDRGEFIEHEEVKARIERLPAQKE